MATLYFLYPAVDPLNNQILSIVKKKAITLDIAETLILVATH
jgi:hypothetical protein